MNQNTPENIEEYIEKITSHVRELLHERSEKLLEAWQESINDALDEDPEAKIPQLKIGISAAIDINEHPARVSTQISFAARYVSKMSEQIEDKNQLKIEFPPCKQNEDQ